MRRLKLAGLGAALGLASLFLGSFVVFRKNRILDGVVATATGAFGWRVAYAAVPLFAVLVSAVWAGFVTRGARHVGANRTGPRRVPGFGRVDGAADGAAPVGAARWLATLSAFAANVAIVAATLLVEGAARAYDARLGHLTRVSFGYGYWLLVLAGYVILDQALPVVSVRWARGALAYASPVAILGLLLGGRIRYVSLVKEFANVRDIFLHEFARHVYLSAGSVAVAVVLGVGLALAAARRPSVEGPLFAVLNVAQVIPTLSFVGFLMIPLGYLGERFALARALDIRGVGWAPVFVVLVFYALYPITRNTVAALRAVSGAYLEPARALGYGPVRLFFEIELPLALPIVFAGIRVALIQASAGTIIAALVGGGGLGVFVFLGLAQTAQDLALLGVVPIVALAFLYDALARAAERAVAPGGVRAAEARA